MELAKSFTIVSLDALGHGKSDRGGDPSGYLISSRAQAVAGLAAHLGFQKFGVVGFSLGGRAALELAASRCAALAGAVVIGMKARMTAEDVRRITPRVRALRSGRVLSLRQDRQRPNGNDAESLALSLEGVARWRGVWDLIHRIESPLLMVCGDKDPYYLGAHEAARAMRYGEFLALPGVDHDGSFRHSRLSLPVVLGFMARVSGRHLPAGV